MNKPLVIGIGLFLLVLFVLFSTTYSVSYHEVAIKKTFGQTSEDSVVREAGLKPKLPIFADQITKYDTRLQLLESPLETIPTADGQQIVVDAFMLWQIDIDGDGPLRFDNTYRSIDGAAMSIRDQFITALNAGLSQFRFDELVGSDSRLAEAEQAILEELDGLEANGILPRTVGISRMQLPSAVTTAVLARMKATRETLADAERFKGQAEAERIESEARTMADRIINFANQRAEEIRARGNQEAATYIGEMAQDEELAIFLVYLDALEMALSERTTLVLEGHREPWNLMRLSTPTNSRGIPGMPEGAEIVARPDDAVGGNGELGTGDEPDSGAGDSGNGDSGNGDSEDGDSADDKADDGASAAEKGN